MGLKALEMYQGSDWLTYRWPVAQAFDTLDRIRDLCLQIPSASHAENAARHSDDDDIVLQTERMQNNPEGQQEEPYLVSEEDLANAFSYVAELCDDLSGEMDAVQADLFPYLKNNLTNRWAGFEMRLYLNELRRQTKRGNHSADAIIILAARIKELFKQIDQ